MHVSLDKQQFELKSLEINERYLVRLMLILIFNCIFVSCSTCERNCHGFLNQVRHQIEHQAGNIIELTIDFDYENQLEIHIVW